MSAPTPPPRRHGPSYWLPRILLGLFALSLAFPLPRYLAGLEGGEYAVWLSQVSWVGQWALLLLLAGAAGVWLGKRRRGRAASGRDDHA